MKEEEEIRINKEMEQKLSCKHRETRLMHHPDDPPLSPAAVIYKKILQARIVRGPWAAANCRLLTAVGQKAAAAQHR